MKRTIGTALICLLGLMSALSAAGQTSGQGWTLRQCIDYARENNIQVQSSQVSLQSARVDLQQAKADRTPTLGFTTSQNVIHQKKENENFSSDGTYSGNYALNAGLTLYNGGKLKHSLRQQQIVNRSKEYEVEVARNDIEIAVTQAYLEILYRTRRSRRTPRPSSRRRPDGTVESAARSRSIARSDYAQMEAQYSSDCYQLTVSENDLAQARLQLKQLLELGIDSTFDVVFPEIDSSTVLAEVPRLEEVYRTALEVMPQMESGRLNIQSALAGERVAKADGPPTVTASAAIGTGNTSGTNYSFYNQLNNKLNESAGITVSVPIFNNRQARTSRAKARLETRQAELNYADAEKSLLTTVESLYQDAVSAQSRYRAATDKVRSAGLSYSLILGQFEAGMKNTVELLTEKNNYLAAQQEQIQAKYQAVLSIRLLDFYRNVPIEL